jgi:hypothetical protein
MAVEVEAASTVEAVTANCVQSKGGFITRREASVVSQYDDVCFSFFITRNHRMARVAVHHDQLQPSGLLPHLFRLAQGNS